MCALSRQCWFASFLIVYPLFPVCAVREECSAAKAKKAERSAPKPEPRQFKPQAAPQPPPPQPKYAPPPPPPQPKTAPPPPPTPKREPEETKFQNHYTLLGVVEFTATSIEIKKAFHKMALKYHPDKVGTRDA